MILKCIENSFIIIECYQCSVATLCLGINYNENEYTIQQSPIIVARASLVAMQHPGGGKQVLDINIAQVLLLCNILAEVNKVLNINSYLYIIHHCVSM